MQKKVLVLNPYCCRDYYSDITVQWKKRTNLLHPPIFLAYIAAYLRLNGIKVVFLDAAGESLDFKQNLKRILEVAPDLIITKTHFSTWGWEDKLFKKVKETLEIPIVSVGIHPTLSPQELLRAGSIDIAVRNEPEISCFDIARGINLANIDGITYGLDSRIIDNPDRKLIEDLDILPFPARDLFPHKNYRLSSYRRKPMTVVYTARGCYFHCIHCGQQRVWRDRRRVRSSRNVIKEIEEIYRQGYREISFEDQSLECDARMIEIAGALNKYKFSWKFGTRPDFINDRTLKIFRESGCYEVFLGVESGNQQCLDWLNKGIGIKQIEEAFRICRKNKLFINATFMIGLPQEDINSVKKTIELAKRLNPDYATFYAFTPLPGTVAFDFYNSNKLLARQDWALIDFQESTVKTEYLSSKEIEGLINQAYKQFYFRPKYMLGMLKKIKSFSLIGALASCYRLIISLLKFNLNPKDKVIILEAAKKEYKRFEEARNSKDAFKKAIDYRKRGFYFAVPVKEEDGWRVYFE